ncbi:YggS family pyridoxal phosphate-dependent enzyme [Ktedonospora formicarum]|uniref:Pyridoxal phosphate homeostasis protein n=1 Tax=Ktedonospora formicarum TaxID=2778364 RepID=A0A8J3MQA5_9CHLR|nr:YggS family pyridoxal phosphate-dependent enzyme [Ktedonospora formicarum]GHO44697.1 YggS family pyridoxal phosphate enzyme [Ktedonospora formicarum]
MIDNIPLNQIETEMRASIAQVQANIANAAKKAGRDLSEVTLVAVSKTKPLEMIQIAYNLGIRHFGENRVQEALTKIAAFHPDDLVWHMIGHLQTNKARKVVSAFDIIQSVDSLHLAQTLERLIAEEAEESGKRLPVLLEVNVAAEASKAGLALSDVPSVARQIATLPHLEVRGLMTVAPQVEDAEGVRPVFRALRQARDQLRSELTSCVELSMGMTNDYAIAIEEGATIVRVGRAIFGAREPV